MENVQENLAQAHEVLKSVDTSQVGQPHKDVFEKVLNTLLHLLPVIIGLFHHATGQPPIILPGTSLPVETAAKKDGE